MKIIRFQMDGKEKTGLIEDLNIIELKSSVLESLNDINLDKFKKNSSYPLENIKIKAPVSPSKVVCVGLNYQDHAAELNMDLPQEPVIFLKPPTSIIGHQDSIIYPYSSHQVDYEAEMGIIISKKAKNIKEKNAGEFIGGYTVLNDVTARDLQKKDGQWTRAKSFDTFAPVGPVIETEMDPHNQNIFLKLNGEIKQDSNTKKMIFAVEELLEFISHIMTLNPGDIIATGTPPGVGSMQPGDRIEAGVEDIGVLENQIIRS
ncbi:MAG: fumarylacetoacetate hydrolase family protein [Euryarchaeota archaeon]|nr:fumarylacetoacetate hydrolase family protein [Euryarchaeota archaeon]MBV1728920.1 fumarylacetoacetate hydrolase family protein [Methanobacterium sp.]MBU4548059.1 fumarylacetoacetate hydrolase family protein [Euryarchaeota archaeon]MBU4608240.1 fumarylacetoacetate hydrolase family protein [Euryarchaeota archaeon]MBV1755243.1 fumarylacetoacetate hydrolase family protein [Methanobacterium sp.]